MKSFSFTIIIVFISCFNLYSNDTVKISGKATDFNGKSLDSVTILLQDKNFKTLYETTDWATAQLILHQYNIRYVVSGYLERSSYSVSEQKFAENLLLVLQENGTNLYEVP